MIRSKTAASLVALVLATSGATAARAADGTLQEGRSVGNACSSTAAVCAVLRDGSMKETDECAARRDHAARILSGACFDAD